MGTITRYISLDETDEYLAEGWAVSPFGDGHHCRYALATKDETVDERTGTDRRREVLREAERCVCQDRQASYSDAEDNFANIAALANVVLAGKLSAPLDRADVALFSICIKLGRLAFNPRHADSVTDLVGYGACLGGILKAEEERLP